MSASQTSSLARTQPLPPLERAATKPDQEQVRLLAFRNYEEAMKRGDPDNQKKFWLEAEKELSDPEETASSD